MNIEDASSLIHETMLISLMVSAPVLGTALVSGLVISILQAATQVNEQTLTFVPKIVVVLGLFGLLFPWIMQVLTTFAGDLLVRVATRGGP